RIPGCRALATPQAVADAADLVLLTVPDDAIRAVADGVRWRPGVAAVHCSGAAGLDVLAAAAAAGAAVGSCHPLQSFADAAAALGDRAPHVVELYRRLGLATIPIAVDKGTLTAEAAGQLRALLSASAAATEGESCVTEALARGLKRQEAATAGTEGESCA